MKDQLNVTGAGSQDAVWELAKLSGVRVGRDGWIYKGIVNDNGKKETDDA